MAERRDIPPLQGGYILGLRAIDILPLTGQIVDNQVLNIPA